LEQRRKNWLQRDAPDAGVPGKSRTRPHNPVLVGATPALESTRPAAGSAFGEARNAAGDGFFHEV